MADGIYVPKRITLFDTDSAEEGLNLAPAKASVLRESAGSMNALATRSRPIFSWWGGTSAITSNTVTSTLWWNSNPGSPGLRAHTIILPTDVATPGQPASTQGITYSIDALLNGDNAEASGTTVVLPLAEQRFTGGTTYPRHCKPWQSIDDHTSYQDDCFYRIQLGSATTTGPELRSGVIFEKNNTNPRLRHIKDEGDGSLDSVHCQGIPTDWAVPGAPIIGAPFGVQDVRTLDIYRDFYRSMVKGRRLAFGWCTILPGSAYIEFDTSPTNYRYIFDQSIGQSGTTPTATGPGINIPLRYTGTGRNTTVRVYTAVYARMSAGSSTGGLGTYNLAADGSIQGPTAMVNGPTISGTTFQWYPEEEDDEANPHFLGQADPARRYDHVLLCAKRLTGSANVRIAAFAMFAYRSYSG